MNSTIYDDCSNASPKIITARRCVSCLTNSNKPKLFSPSFSTSTLPPQKECAFHPGYPSTNHHILWNLGSQSSNSSRTATSSGVALTGDSTSSPMTDGSKETTRPNSLAIGHMDDHQRCNEMDSVSVCLFGCLFYIQSYFSI